MCNKVRDTLSTTTPSGNWGNLTGLLLRRGGVGRRSKGGGILLVGRAFGGIVKPCQV